MEKETDKKRQADKLETERRIRAVQEWILLDNTSSDIIKQARTLWNITDRQGYRYLWAARKFFQEKDEQTLKGKISYYLARKKKLLRDMNPEEKKTAVGVAAVSRVLDSMAKLEGVTVDTLKLIGDPELPVVTKSDVTFKAPIDYSKLPVEFLDMVLANRKTVNV